MANFTFRIPLLFLTMVVALNVSLGQAIFQDRSVETNFELVAGTDQDIELHTYLKNTTNQTIDLKWVREMFSNNRDWETAICDYTCYLPFVSEMTISLDPDVEIEFIVHLYTREVGVIGDSMKVNVYLENLSGALEKDTLTATFRSSSGNSSTIGVNSKDQISISPNPARESIRLSHTHHGKVEIYSIIGSKVKTFDDNAPELLPIDDLHPGMYLVRIYDHSNTKVLTTQRLKVM